MPITPQDEFHLTRAIALAREAAGQASPNPTVGCVIAQGETTLGEGAHLYDNRDHAEIAALKQAASQGHNVQGATAYVTLEPCAHHGRTGPCADALIAAGIARCVVATVDPNPLVSGKGLDKLRAANMEVEVAQGELAEEARRLNDAFAHFIQHRRPFVTLKAGLSVDGKLAPPASTRTAISPHWITGAIARKDAQQLRYTSDAILAGIGTVLADNPSLTDRTGLQRRRPLLRVVLDSNLRVSLESALITSVKEDVIILCSEDAPRERETALRDRDIETVRIAANNNRLDLRAALKVLAERDVISVLIEAGSAINGSFLRADLVDKLVLYYAEQELGINAIPFAEDFASPYLLQQQMTQTTRSTFPNGDTEDVRITGYLHDPWASA
jgi:diaminohydroxyphosphoribosylaminopyrimidine deaminase/5-amino-6-(5-phosphoribosylamino)uracil reductase